MQSGRDTLHWSPQTDTGQTDPQLAEADQAEKAHNWLRAEDLYRSVLRGSPSSVPALTRLARLLDAEGQHLAAQALWVQAVKLVPANNDYKVALASSYISDNEPQDAIALLAPVAAQDNANADVLFDLGTAYARQESYQDAIALFRRSAALSGTAGMADLSLAKSLATLMRYDEAKPAVIQYLVAHPSDYDALMVAATVYKGVRDWKGAEAILRRALQVHPASFDALAMLGGIEREESKLDDAVAHLTQAEHLDPSSKEVHFQLLRIYHAQGQSEPAREQERKLKAAEDAAQQEVQATVLGNAAARAASQGNYQEAISSYTRALSLVPNTARVQYDLALIYEKAGNRRKERELLDEAEKQDPNLPGVHSQKGFLDLAEGKLAEAEPELQQAIRANPECVEALGNLGVLYARTGRLKEAERLLRWATADDSSYSRGYVNLALVLASQHRIDEAMQLLQAELARDPHDQHAAATLKLLTGSNRSPQTAQQNLGSRPDL